MMYLYKFKWSNSFSAKDAIYCDLLFVGERYEVDVKIVVECKAKNFKAFLISKLEVIEGTFIGDCVDHEVADANCRSSNCNSS